MNFTQMHEHVRLELLRRIQRGTLSVSLLARQTGFGQSHMSNFLRSRRQLSLEALDRVLASQHLTVGDLLPAAARAAAPHLEDEGSSVPLVSHAVALFEPTIRPSVVQMWIHLPVSGLNSIRPPARVPRRPSHRFVAVRIPSEDAYAMDPVVFPGAIVLLDRHDTSLTPYRPNRPNIYAVRHGSHLVLRYVDVRSSRMVLRPHNIAFPVDLVEIERDQSPRDFIAGRAVLIFNEL